MGNPETKPAVEAGKPSAQGDSVTEDVAKRFQSLKDKLTSEGKIKPNMSDLQVTARIFGGPEFDCGNKMGDETPMRDMFRFGPLQKLMTQTDSKPADLDLETLAEMTYCYYVIRLSNSIDAEAKVNPDFWKHTCSKVLEEPQHWKQASRFADILEGGDGDTSNGSDDEYTDCSDSESLPDEEGMGMKEYVKSCLYGDQSQTAKKKYWQELGGGLQADGLYRTIKDKMTSKGEIKPRMSDLEVAAKIFGHPDLGMDCGVDFTEAQLESAFRFPPIQKLLTQTKKKVDMTGPQLAKVVWNHFFFAESKTTQQSTTKGKKQSARVTDYDTKTKASFWRDCCDEVLKSPAIWSKMTNGPPGNGEIDAMWTNLHDRLTRKGKITTKTPKLEVSAKIFNEPEMKSVITTQESEGFLTKPASEHKGLQQLLTQVKVPGASLTGPQLAEAVWYFSHHFFTQRSVKLKKPGSGSLSPTLEPDNPDYWRQMCVMVLDDGGHLLKVRTTIRIGRSN